MKQPGRGWIGRLWSFNGPDGAAEFAEDIAQRIQIAQVSSWVKIGMATVPVGMTVALLLGLRYLDRFGHPWLTIGFTGVLGGYIGLFRVCQSWRDGAHGDADAAIRRLILARLVLGSFWGIALVAMMSVSNPDERILVVALAISLISTAAFNGPSIYAFSFWLPVTLGGFGTLFANGHLLDMPILICMSLYALLTFLAILAFDRQSVERNLNMLRLEQHAETIGILLREFEENSCDWLWETGPDLTVRNVSSRFAEVAMQAEAAMKIDLISLLTGAGEPSGPPVASPQADRAIAQLRQRLTSRSAFRELVVPVTIKGELRWWALSGKPVMNSRGDFIGFRGVGADVTAAQLSDERIGYLARHDTLTDLANRACFNETLQSSLAGGADLSSSDQAVALLCLDLDEFKAVNDSYGHNVGDTVLRAVALRIRGVLREHDLAARLGGDEFAVLIAVSSRDEAARVAERIIDCIRPAFTCGELVIKIGISVGIAVGPVDGDTPEKLYQNADLALYRAKAEGRGAWRFYDADMDRHILDQRLLQRDIREALSQGDFHVAYQPIVDVTTRQITSLEALVRWRHPVRGNICPDDFIPLAERSGLIGPIGAAVLAAAVELASRLPPFIRIAVNLSPLQLHDEFLVARVGETLAGFAVPSHRIEFEITESVILETSGRALENLQALRARGHPVAIDDFGTGYSSLAVLNRFAFDRMKIDRSFIAAMDGAAQNGPIVKAIIGLGRELGITVTAEGVETKRQAEILRQYQCTSAQGFYFYHPLSAHEVVELLTPSTAWQAMAAK
jgi:diguanylate cyclase (GGDEF)-like protein